MQATKKEKSSPGAYATSYLKLYNFLSALGWVYVLFLSLQTALTWKSLDDVTSAKDLYKTTSFFLKILLSTSYLEIFHAAFKLVPSNPVIIFPQVFIRWIVIFGVVDNFSTSSKSIAFAALISAWSISEIIRYLYYVSSNNYILTWCRYNFFIVLYPIGAGAEMICTGLAANFIKPLNIRTLYSYGLPNKLNISLDLYWLFWIWILLYIPGFPFMYLHVFKQRSKALYSKKGVKKQN